MQLALELLGLFLFVGAVLWTLTALHDIAERVARRNRKE